MKEPEDKLSPRTFEGLQYALEEGYHKFEYGDSGLGARIVLSVIPYLLDWGYIELAAANIEMIFDRLSEPGIEAECFWNTALIADLRSNYTEAFRNFGYALGAYEMISDHNGEARCFFRLGRLFNAAGKFDDANHYFDKCIALCVKEGVTGGWAASLLDMGWNINERTGNTDRAIELYNESIEKAKETRDFNTLSAAKRQVGFLLWTRKNRPEEALRCYDDALKIANEYNLAKEKGAIYAELGYIYSEKGDLDEAAENCHKCIAIYSALGNNYGLISAYANLGKIYESRSELELAVEWYDKSFELATIVNNPGGQAWALTQLGQIYSEQGDTRAAMIALKKASKLSEKNQLKEIRESSQEQLRQLRKSKE